jgi:hypothetical protein
VLAVEQAVRRKVDDAAVGDRAIRHQRPGGVEIGSPEESAAGDQPRDLVRFQA